MNWFSDDSEIYVTHKCPECGQIVYPLDQYGNKISLMELLSPDRDWVESAPKGEVITLPVSGAKVVIGLFDKGEL